MVFLCSAEEPLSLSIAVIDFLGRRLLVGLTGHH